MAISLRGTYKINTGRSVTRCLHRLPTLSEGSSRRPLTSAGTGSPDFDFDAYKCNMVG